MVGGNYGVKILARNYNKIEYTFLCNLKKTNHIFYGCKSLTNINLSNFNTQNVTNMSFMFRGCETLQKDNIITNDNKILQEYSN